jgi:hypothetical protein
MTIRTVYVAIIAVSLVAGSQLAVHYAIDAVTKAGTLESKLFQPELRPSNRLNSIALAQASSGPVR